MNNIVLKGSGTGLRTTWLHHSYFLCEADSSFSVWLVSMSVEVKKIIKDHHVWLTRVVSQTFSCVKYQHVTMSNTRLIFNSLWFRILCFYVTKWFHRFWDIHSNPTHSSHSKHSHNENFSTSFLIRAWVTVKNTVYITKWNSPSWWCGFGCGC